MLSATTGESPCCLMIALLMLEPFPSNMGAVQSRGRPNATDSGLLVRTSRPLHGLVNASHFVCDRPPGVAASNQGMGHIRSRPAFVRARQRCDKHLDQSIFIVRWDQPALR